MNEMLNAVLEPLPPNLCGAWRDRRRFTLTEAAEHLSAELGRRYRHQRVWDWCSGNRPIPEDVARLMRRELLESIFGKETGAAFAKRLTW